MESNLSPIGWALRPLKRYAEFSGRSSRAEFWWYSLMCFILYIVMWFSIAGAVIGSLMAAQTGSAPSAGLVGGLGMGMIVIALVLLLLLIPTIAVQIRRLHDTDRSGWWLGGYYLLYAVYVFMAFRRFSATMSAAMAGGAAPPQADVTTTIIGFGMFVYFIVLLVFYCLPGTKGANRYGADPYGQDVEQVFA